MADLTFKFPVANSLHGNVQGVLKANVSFKRLLNTLYSAFFQIARAEAKIAHWLESERGEMK